MLTSGVMFLYDNACPHTTACTEALLEHFNWELFDCPACIPEQLSPVYLPEELVGITALQMIMRSVQYKCLNSSSDYVEE
jgi:DNA-binding helix-hairpin-helix protein with protein kinase domain